MPSRTEWHEGPRNYAYTDGENVIMPWAAGCQVPGIYAYRELGRERPRGLVGLTDISARRNVRASLGENVMSFTAPWPLFQEMGRNVAGGFLEREGATFVPEKPRVWIAKLGGTMWDLAPDGKRVLVVTPVESARTPDHEDEVVFLENFFDYLRQRAPAGK